MRIKDITSYLETLAPLSYQESYDNSGLIVGDPNWEVKGVLVSLDCIESIIDEAIAKGCNLIVAHHPIVFSGLKKLNGKNYIERTVIKAIKNDIGIYAIHTNLDNVALGVNKRIADQLGLVNTGILAPKSDVLKKLEVYAPSNNLAELKKALFNAGAGEDSKYKDCSYVGKGEESFTPLPNANPFLGEKEKTYLGETNKLEMVFPAFLEGRVKTETIRKGSPHTLRIIKTQANYEHQLKNWHKDVALLEKVKTFNCLEDSGIGIQHL